MATEEAKGKIALITGITGQDGSYLTELLLAKGYTVRRLEYVNKQGPRWPTANSIPTARYWNMFSNT
jgi:GDP-mannose 4,6 dehydratase